MGARVVVITTADPTGAVERSAFEVTPAPEPGTERAVLAQLVRGIHPGAVELEGDGPTARFRDGGLEITAAFGDDAPPTPPPAPPGQGSLFDP